MAKRSKGRKAKFDKKNGVVDLREYRKDRERQSREERRAQKETPAEETPVAAKHAKKKRVSRKMSGRRALVYAVVICILACMVGYSTYNIYKAETEKNSLIAEQQKLTKEKKELREELKKVNDPDYIEEEARDKLKMVMPGETLYVMPDKDSK
ncbi:MAG: septum formation initiator family protein [Eubacteriaceae bacterium]|jgi:cell division protein FtsL|nr:septum formation initiator family protein [Eubacteriaceae bacterium]